MGGILVLTELAAARGAANCGRGSHFYFAANCGWLAETVPSRSPPKYALFAPCKACSRRPPPPLARFAQFLFATPAEDAPLKAIDFGISVFCEPGQWVDLRAGTPIYIAPEVLRSRYSLPADVWSLGIVAYQLLTGKAGRWMGGEANPSEVRFHTAACHHRRVSSRSCDILHPKSRTALCPISACIAMCNPQQQSCGSDLSAAFETKSHALPAAPAPPGRLPFSGEEGAEVAELYMTKQVYNNKDVFRAVLYSDLDFTSPPWDRLSGEAKDLVQSLLQRDGEARPSAEEALRHPWLQVGSKGGLPSSAKAVVHLRQRVASIDRRSFCLAPM